MVENDIKDIVDLLELAQEKMGNILLDLHAGKQGIDDNIIESYETLSELIKFIDFKKESGKNKNAANKRKKSRKT